MHYSTYKGKTYSKAFVIAQANKAVHEEPHLVLPNGVVFRSVEGPDPYVVIQRLPFKGRFLVEPMNYDGFPIHAMALSVDEILEIPDNCPPLHLWDRS